MLSTSPAYASYKDSQIEKIISEECDLVRQLCDEQSCFDANSTSANAAALRKKRHESRQYAAGTDDDESANTADEDDEEDFVVHRNKRAPPSSQSNAPSSRKKSVWNRLAKPKTSKKRVVKKKSDNSILHGVAPSAAGGGKPSDHHKKEDKAETEEEKDFQFEEGQTVLDLLPDPTNELCLAAWEGKTKEVKSVLLNLTKQSSIQNFLLDGDEQYALHCACAGGHAEIVKTLITSGASQDVLLHGKKPIAFAKSKIIKMVIKTFTLLDKEMTEVIGLSEVKQNLYQLANKIILDKKREEAGFKTSKQGRDMVLEGNPGVGKTSIARLISTLYYELGVTNRKTIVEVQRSDIVGSYVGQTGPKTRQIIESAKGGVLFVDEAYRLSNVQGKDFGQEAIDEIMQFMNGSDADVVFIFAGYKKEMEQFIASNPGMFRRISYRLHFQDYTPLEMAQILMLQVPHKKYKLHDDVTLEYLKNLIEQHTTQDLRSKMNGGLSSKLVDVAIEYQNEELSLDETGETLLLLQKRHFERAITRFVG